MQGTQLKYFAPGSTDKFISCFVHYWPNFKCSIYLANTSDMFICTSNHGWLIGNRQIPHEFYLRFLHDLDVIAYNYYSNCGEYKEIHHEEYFDHNHSIFDQM